jgi:F-type H+-transporting ATPase subunit alpha
LNRGARLTELLKQPQYSPLSIQAQVPIIFAGVNGYLDKIPVQKVVDWEKDFISHVATQHNDILEEIRTQGVISKDLEAKLRDVCDNHAKGFY